MHHELPDTLNDPTTALLGAPSLWRDEDPAQFDQLMAALNAEFAPVTAYEKILVRHLADLQWDYLRYRRLRDARLKRQIALEAAAMLEASSGRLLDFGMFSPENEAIGRALVGSDMSAQQKAQDQIVAAGLAIGDILSEAYHKIAAELSPHEQRMAAIINERRHLREELHAIQKLRRPLPPDAELVAE